MIRIRENRSLIKIVRIIIFCFVPLLFPKSVWSIENSSSLNNKTYQIQTIVFSSLGSGLSLSYKFKNNIWLNLDTQSTSGTMSRNSSDGLTREDVDYDFQTTYLNGRYYFDKIFNNLFIQTGILSKNWDTKSVTKNNENNQKRAVYTTNYPRNGFNFGIGKNWVSTNGFSAGLYFVRIISSEPSFTYDLEEGWKCEISCKSDYEGTVQRYTPTNSVYLNIGYNFDL